MHGSAPILSLSKGLDPATGARLSTLVHDRPVAVLSGPNMADEVAAGLPGAAVIASEDEALALQAAGRDQLARLPRLREHRRRRRRAVRRGEERDRACGRRRRRARARRQREVRDHHARARRDGAARRGVRRVVGDVRRPRRHGRSDGLVLPPDRAQPPRGRADRARRDAGRGACGDRPGRRGPDDGAGAARAFASHRGRAADHRRRLRGARRDAAARARRDASWAASRAKSEGYHPRREPASGSSRSPRRSRRRLRERERRQLDARCGEHRPAERARVRDGEHRPGLGPALEREGGARQVPGRIEAASEGHLRARDVGRRPVEGRVLDRAGARRRRSSGDAEPRPCSASRSRATSRRSSPQLGTKRGARADRRLDGLRREAGAARRGQEPHGEPRRRGRLQGRRRDRSRPGGRRRARLRLGCRDRAARSSG